MAQGTRRSGGHFVASKHACPHSAGLQQSLQASLLNAISPESPSSSPSAWRLACMRAFWPPLQACCALVLQHCDKAQLGDKAASSFRTCIAKCTVEGPVAARGGRSTRGHLASPPMSATSGSWLHPGSTPRLASRAPRQARQPALWCHCQAQVGRLLATRGGTFWQLPTYGPPCGQPLKERLHTERACTLHTCRQHNPPTLGCLQGQRRAPPGAAPPTAAAPAAASPALSSSTGAASQAEAQARPAVESFNWLAAWYPVLPLSALQPDRPRALRLLGMELVVWRDGATGAWAAARDSCPHRCGVQAAVVCMCP